MAPLSRKEETAEMTVVTAKGEKPGENGREYLPR
jgi:hypothetical protein